MSDGEEFDQPDFLRDLAKLAEYLDAGRENEAADLVSKTILLAVAKAEQRGAEREREEWPCLLNQMRADGWSVAVHNDYRLNGEAHTFWLFTKNGRAVKGEGQTDAEALAAAIRAAIARSE